MQDREPTVRSRELGEGLRQAMERAGLNGREAAHLLGWSPSWVSRLLSGKRGGSALDIAAFLGVCRVKSAERDRLLALCQEQYVPGWLQQHGYRLPKELVTLINHENRAVRYHDVQPLLVPGRRRPVAVPNSSTRASRPRSFQDRIVTPVISKLHEVPYWRQARCGSCQHLMSVIRHHSAPEPPTPRQPGRRVLIIWR